MNNVYVVNATGPSETISDTNTHTAGTGQMWGVIVVVSAAEFTTLTGTRTGYSGVTYPAGHVITGSFTAITLASGIVDAYLRP